MKKLLIGFLLLFIVGSSTLIYLVTIGPTKQTDYMFQYQRHGGIMGFCDNVTIYADGTAKARNNCMDSLKDVEIQSENINALLQQLESLPFYHFLSPWAHYHLNSLSDECCDMITEIFEYKGRYINVESFKFNEETGLEIGTKIENITEQALRNE